ncbi:MAG: hypothetical protein M0P71_12805 [Melioribacteraceae bacterium]|jgi:hypothetical protein|nr:hypothetical protein [Melioribacteraceae bacterium]
MAETTGQKIVREYNKQFPYIHLSSVDKDGVKNLATMIDKEIKIAFDKGWQEAHDEYYDPLCTCNNK